MSTTKKNHLAHAATILPLAIGLAMNSGGGTRAPAARSHQPPSASPAAVAGTHPFMPVCTFPFPGGRIPEVDDRCPLEGGSSDPAKQAESRSKNNFCVATGPSQPITYQQLVDLQQKSNSINAAHLVDRSPLNQLGEGRYVEYVAFIQDAHYSDVASGEAVNCNIPGNPTNDIHIVLVQNLTDDACKSTTAELSPHFRLAEWTPANLNATRPHPVKISGHLFYDGSHTPCTATSRPNPKRISLWEVHPAYKIEVCRLTDIAQCQNSANAADWDPFETFLKNDGVTVPSTEQ